MRRVWAMAAALSVAAAASGCGDPGCHGAPAQCIDHENLRDCTVSPSQVLWCPAECERAGAEVFLGCRALGADPCGCDTSGAAPLPCTAGATRCLDADTLLRCEHRPELADGMWEGLDCLSLCVSIGAQVGICAAMPDGGSDCFCDSGSLLGPR